jgi:hypothetical protein
MLSPISRLRRGTCQTGRARAFRIDRLPSAGRRGAASLGGASPGAGGGSAGRGSGLLARQTPFKRSDSRLTDATSAASWAVVGP